MQILPSQLFIGSTISKCCEMLVAEAIKLQDQVKCELNGIELVAEPTTEATTLAKFYHDEVTRQHNIYLESDEYKQSQKKNALEVAALQSQVNHKVAEMDILDFKNLESVLNWVVELQPLTSRTGVKVPAKVKEKFATHGYLPGINCGKDFNENDQKNFAGYIIGQALSTLDTVGAIHPLIVRFTKEWKIRFILH